jgi:hypothetical protein
MRAAYADEDYFKVLGMEILQGRAFIKEPYPQESLVFIINEEAARIMGLKEPVVGFPVRCPIDYCPYIIRSISARYVFHVDCAYE